MSEKANKAVENHKSFYSCSASVLCAFADEAGMSEQEARAAAAPFAGGRMGKCGAVLAAEYVLSKRFPDSVDEKLAAFEKEFTDMNRSVICRELKGALTGSPLRSCRGCVTDAAEILERMCSE
ncbi:C-GCAxxG-C-C family protein [Ruminococcus flavefaciens]|uniref:C-GCAxxG-C-C family protein n=1 Tax=Ruminococcus flavefaciens TaxID=1265 RepID=UPI0026F145DA|nr:C-GCAxxG-C-C family protein [Ruminococcus flavefaciens]